MTRARMFGADQEFLAWCRKQKMLPSYSPDLNPVEDLWGNVKSQQLANRCVEGLGEAEAAVRNGMERVRQSELPLSFLHHAGLFF